MEAMSVKWEKQASSLSMYTFVLGLSTCNDYTTALGSGQK